MNIKITRMIALLCVVVLCFAGCQQSEEVPSITESQIWETMPALTYGQMEYEKLKVEPWYCGRMEATGLNLWAETKDGFYHSSLVYPGSLIFADKGEMFNWVHVCRKPNCTHPEGSFTCESYIGFSTFSIYDGRIYFAAHNDFFPELSLTKDSSEGLYSKALNGADMRLEKLMEDTVITNGGYATCGILRNYWIYNTEILNADGSVTGITYCYDILTGMLTTPFYMAYPVEADYHSEMRCPEYYKLYGDPTVINLFLGTDFYRVENGEMVPTNTETYAKAGDYLSGCILRQFRSNEGYYDINLQTGEEVHLADAQLKNSQSFIVLPNCTIETTLGSENHQEGDQHSMMLFDGESWRTVALPEELTQSYTLDMPFEMGVVTSDRIIILVYNNQRYSRCNMYQIMLGKDELTMEFCAELKK